jgi:nitroreductase
MAELLPSLQGRFSCRQFKREPVAKAQLDLILESGRIAPSAFGMEPWRFVVVQSPAARKKVATACLGQHAANTAPVMFAFVALVDALVPDSAFVEARLTAESGGSPPSNELREAWRGLYAQIDPKSWAISQCNFAASQMMVQATALGLASCPMGGFDEQALAKSLGLAQGEAPALVLAVGYCAEAQRERSRRGMGELLEII